MSAFHILRRSGAQHVAVLLHRRLILARGGGAAGIGSVSLRLPVALVVLVVLVILVVLAALRAALVQLLTHVLAGKLLALAQ
ncbi:hypothetical protein ACTXI4_01655 [Glutamicibacter ardleyensis]|uniref:hypothetical protein n=1 Tax=Glutamicibacter ardleyensis TaxID=225894 RepID=UPI003FD6413B